MLLLNTLYKEVSNERIIDKSLIKLYFKKMFLGIIKKKMTVRKLIAIHSFDNKFFRLIRESIRHSQTVTILLSISEAQWNRTTDSLWRVNCLIFIIPISLESNRDAGTGWSMIVPGGGQKGPPLYTKSSQVLSILNVYNLI